MVWDALSRFENFIALSPNLQPQHVQFCERVPSESKSPRNSLLIYTLATGMASKGVRARSRQDNGDESGSDSSAGSVSLHILLLPLLKSIDNIQDILPVKNAPRPLQSFPGQGSSKKPSTRGVAIKSPVKKYLTTRPAKATRRVVSSEKQSSSVDEDAEAVLPLKAVSIAKTPKPIDWTKIKEWSWVVRPGEQDPNFYQVEAIKARAIHTTGSSSVTPEDAYLIKWEGYDEETWEPVKNMELYIPKMVKRFEKGLLAGESSTVRASRTPSTPTAPTFNVAAPASVQLSAKSPGRVVCLCSLLSTSHNIFLGFNFVLVHH